MSLVLFSLVLVLVQPWPLFQFHRGRPAAVDTVLYWKFFYKSEKKSFSDEWLCFILMSVLINIRDDSLIVTNSRNRGKISQITDNLYSDR